LEQQRKTIDDNSFAHQYVFARNYNDRLWVGNNKSDYIECIRQSRIKINELEKQLNLINDLLDKIGENHAKI
jgi:hypothetical protein